MFGTSDEILQAMCRAFLMPIFSRATLYADTLPALAAYRKQGYPIGIVSNCPWGSPGALWREELKRLGLLDVCDVAIFCTQVGWRKPAQPMFRAAVRYFSCRPQECLFVGDHPRWDVIGARRAGMFPVLMDRMGDHLREGECCIDSLRGLEAILQQWGECTTCNIGNRSVSEVFYHP